MREFRRGDSRIAHVFWAVQMIDTSDYHRRRSIRLKCWDYSRAGAYFVTIRTQNHDCLFGNVENGHMQLNDAGQAVIDA